MKKLNHIKTFESWFKNPFKSEDESSVTPDSIKSRLSSNKSPEVMKQTEDKLKQEAEERFPSVVKELDRLLKNTNKDYIEVNLVNPKDDGYERIKGKEENPTFKTKSTDSVNLFLLNKIKNHYNDLGFKTYTTGYRDDDWFRIIVPED